MPHRILLCLVVLSLVASMHAVEGSLPPDEGASWSFGGDESGGGSSYLGVDIADVTSDRLGALKLKEERGAEVTMVDQDAPAGKAGLREHDVILNLNGTRVDSAAELRRMIRETPAGRVITLGISRDGQPLTLKVQLASRNKAYWVNPGQFKFEMPPMPAMPDIDVPVTMVIAHSSLRSGLMVENITPQLGEFFGVKNGHGVLVRSVEKGSRADKAGFRAGDIVVRVNGQTVRDTSDFTYALRSAAKESASVTVVRDKKEQTLNLPLPGKKDTGFLLDMDDLDTSGLRAQAGQFRDAVRLMKPPLADLQCRTRELKSLQKDWQQRMKESQKRMKQEGEKLRHELAGDWTEI